MSPDQTPDLNPDQGHEPEPAPESASARSRRGETVTGPAWMSALAPRASRAQLLAAVLFALLGFALVVQVQHQREHGLSSLRENELIGLLDQVSANAEQLTAETGRLESERAMLRSGADNGASAQKAAQEHATALGILAGTIAATGPGIRLTIADSSGAVDAAVLLDAVQELRDAGAEAIQINGVRVVAQSGFADAARQIQIDSTPISAPYEVLAIGDPPTMSAALAIPGGVMESVRQHQGVPVVASAARLDVTALHTLTPAQYAQPAKQP